MLKKAQCKILPNYLVVSFLRMKRVSAAEEEHHVQSEKEELRDEEEEPLDGAVSRKASSRKTYFAEPSAE